MACTAGFTMSEFLEITPRELNIALEVYAEKEKRNCNNNITIAYMTAVWIAQWFSKKKPESLSKILKIEKKPQTDNEMLNTVKALNAMFGGEIIKKGADCEC